VIFNNILLEKFKQQLNQPPYLFSREPWTNKVSQFSPPANVDISKLFEAYKGIIEQSKEEAEVLPEAKIKRVITLEERISQLISKLSGGQSFKFSEITSKAEKTEVIITFLAILHLAKEKIISVKQENNFGELFIQSNIKD
jgi:segregation and condensation protein A